MTNVLKWVNEIRAEYDIGPPVDELPAGKRRSSMGCPVAKAITEPGRYTASIGGTSLFLVGSYGSDNFWVDIPNEVQEWIKSYDRTS